MNKKLIVLLMVLALLAGVMSGCAPSTPKQENPNPSGGGEPTPEEPITLKIFAGKYTEHSDWDSMLLWQTYEEMSGIKIEWEQGIGDSFKKIILVKDWITLWRDEEGIVVMGISDFLLTPQ